MSTLDLFAFDVLCRPGSRVRLRARLERHGLFRRPLAGRPVLFRSLPAPGSAGSPHDLGRVVTDRWGCAELSFLPPDCGHHFFELESPGPGGEPTVWTTGLIACRDTSRPAAVIDIDGTLTRESTTLRTPAERSEIKDEHALAATAALAGGYDLLYLTGRRRQQVNATRDWLIRFGLPIGPLFLQMLHFPVPGFVSAMWKTRFLSALRARHPNLTVGIGNTSGDASAYAANGMLPVIFSDRPLNALVVRTWDQVRELLSGDRFPLSAAQTLRLRNGSVMLEIRPGGDVCTVVMTGLGLPDWRPPPDRWPVLRAALLDRLMSLRTRSGGEAVSAGT
jgi:hypothetical protein